MLNLVEQLMRFRPDWLDVLRDSYKIKVTSAGRLVSLSYDARESPLDEPIVQQCRGMVVDTRRNKVLAWPYNKFWNHGEPMGAQIDWSTARVQEKLDGSLMTMYFDGIWHVASSGHPIAGGSFGVGNEASFADAFWETFERLGLRYPSADWHGFSIMLEFCSPGNRVVVHQERPRIVLHGARHTISGLEMGRFSLGELARNMRCELVQEWPLTSVEACLAAARDLDPLKQEGFVVVDGQFNRVKIKSPKYVALHLMKDQFSIRSAIELWQSGERSELLATFPEVARWVDPIHEELYQVAREAASVFAANLHHTSRKTFALAVKDHPYSAIIFKMYAEAPVLDRSAFPSSARAIMRRMPPSALKDYLLVPSMGCLPAFLTVDHQRCCAPFTGDKNRRSCDGE